MTQEIDVHSRLATRSSPESPVVRISAVIACYNDAEAIPIMYSRLIETFTKLGVEYEIIFVNDCSPDNAAEVLSELAAEDPNLVVISHSRPFGSQSAFTSGMRIASGDAVVLLDGDLQDPPELIAEFYALWQQGHDVVYGQRVTRETSPPMRFAYKAFYRLFRRLAYVAIPLDAGDFSLMDRKVVESINRLPESQRFIRGLRAWVGYDSIGVPYRRPERMFGRSTNSLVRNFMWARRGIVAFSYVPLEMILMVALSTVALSIVAGIVEVILKITDPGSAPSGITTLVLLVLFMGGLILLALSTIGFYIADIYTEVKGRPSSVIDSVVNSPIRYGTRDDDQHGSAAR